MVVLEPDSFSIQPIIFEHPACPLDSNGHIKILVSGATPPYKYLWSSGEISDQIIRKKTGNYKVTISDSKNCNIVRSFELKSEDLIPPKLIVKSFKVYLNELGIAIPQISDYLIENSDNCDVSPVLSSNIDTLRCHQLGNQSMIVRSNDYSGNSTIDTVNIEVLDTIKPIIHVWNDTLIKRCDVMVPAIIATDNCPIKDFQKIEGPDPGELFIVGKTTSKFMAIDESNNETIDSFIVEIVKPLHYTIDSFYFNYCLGDSLFTMLSVKHDLHSPLSFSFESDTIQILSDSSFTIYNTVKDSVIFTLFEESGCILEYKTEINYPGPVLILDSVKITHNTDVVNAGKIEVFIRGADSISWCNALDSSYVNNTGIELFIGDYLVKAYKEFCEFVYGPYTVKQILSTANSGHLNFKIYPNPFSEKLTIQSDHKSELEYILLNIRGEFISKASFNSSVDIDLSHINSGIYLLRCTDKQQSKTIRLIKI